MDKYLEPIAGWIRIGDRIKNGKAKAEEVARRERMFVASYVKIKGLINEIYVVELGNEMKRRVIKKTNYMYTYVLHIASYYTRY